MLSTDLTQPTSNDAARLPFGEILDESLPVVEVIPVYGPPLILLLGPWLLFGLLLAGPFAVIVMLVVVFAAAAALVALAGAVVAAPVLLVRHLIARGQSREQRASSRAAAPEFDAWFATQPHGVAR